LIAKSIKAVPVVMALFRKVLAEINRRNIFDIVAPENAKSICSSLVCFAVSINDCYGDNIDLISDILRNRIHIYYFEKENYAIESLPKDIE
jgi:hypothetical protein